MSQKQFIWDDHNLFPADFSEKLRKALWSQEVALAYRPYETLFAYGPDGEWLLRKNGDAGSVKLTAPQLAIARASVWTHNHPTGNTFSPNDVRVAFICQLRELRAVDQRWIYRLRDPDNWSGEKWALIESHLWVDTVKAVAADRSTKVTDLAHEAWRRIFDKLAMNYWRVPWSPAPP